MSTKSYWDKNTDIGYRELGWKQQIFASSLAQVAKGKRVLEIGCGGGALSNYLAEQGAFVVGIDFSGPLIRISEAKYPQSKHLEFLEMDILNSKLDRQFDIICGIAVLHEITYLDTPKLLEFLDYHLDNAGFGWFLENSYFNPFFRLIRKQFVGRFGIPKYGSYQETPFDRERMTLYENHFRFCERSAEVFSLFTQVNRYLVRSRSPSFRKFCISLDQFLTRLHLPNVISRNLSYWQLIYFSHALRKRDIYAALARVEARS